jgi:ABC-type transporter Mla subunit MlaD
MMNRAAAVRVGLLLIAGVAAAVALVLFLSQGTVHDGLRYETYFSESVQGLDIGSPVKFRGVTLGQVSEVGLVTAEYMADQAVDAGRPETRMVVVRWVIDPKRLGRVPDQATDISRGLRARLASQGITGLVYIELDFVDPAKFPADKVPWTPRDIYMPSMPSTITQVQDAAEALADKLQNIDITKMAATFQALLDDLHGELSTGDTHVTLSNLAALSSSLRQGVDQADLPGLAGELRTLTATLRATVDSKDAKSLLAASSQAAERLATAAAKLPPLIAALEATMHRADAGAADVQAELVPVLRDARAAAANLRDTSETLRRYPAAVLLGGPPPRDGGPTK